MSGTHPEQAPERDQDRGDSCKLVGIGASAGGLAALKALFAAVPPDAGAAFVVLMHMSPECPSHLADLLQPHCPLPLLTVEEAVALAPGRVYLMLPGRSLAAIDSHLRLAPPEAESARRPIDQLFSTLADARDGDTLAVILSGAGSDGSEGASRIRARGGLVLVQDPEEAEYDGMSRSAIAAQTADLVLPLAGIRAEILHFCRGTPHKALARPEAVPDDAVLLDDLLATVELHTQRDLRRYRPEVLWPRIRRRMRLTGEGSAADYLVRLRARPEEAVALAREPLFPEAAFFVDSEVCSKLAKEVIPQLFTAKAGTGEALRVWCAGCTSREDGLSLAMLLLEEAERRPRPPELQIFASDPERVRPLAHDGLYPAAIAAQVSPERLQRFFAQEEGGYRLRRELRDQVIFARHDLLTDPPFAHLDLVLCRGLIGLLTAKARERVCATFHFALRPGGLLLLDPGQVPECEDLLAQGGPDSPLWRRREGAAGRRQPAARQRRHAWPPRSPALAQVLPPAWTSAADHTAVHARLAARYAPPSLLVDAHERVLHYSAQVGRYLRLPGGTPSHRLLDLVAEPLRGALQRGLRIAARAGGWHSPSLVVETAAGPERVAIHLEPAEHAEARWLVVIQPLAGLPAESEAPAGAAGELESLLAVSEQQLAAALATGVSERERAELLGEELASVTEEYRLVVEELETSKEELQSANEELVTLNEENLQRIEALGQLSADQQHLLEATGIATLFLDRELRIMRYTPPAAELFRLRCGDRGRPLADLAHRLEHPTLAADARQVLESERGIECEIADQTGRWFLLRVLPYRCHPGRVEGVVISLIDISARRQAEESLRTADRRKDEFLAILAHELRNPLAPMVSGLELLELGADDPALGREVRGRLERQVRQLTRLVDDILDVSRISRGTFRLRKDKTDLTEVVRDAIVAVDSGLRAQGHDLTLALPTAPLPLMADAMRLIQVVSNLLSNAIKYTPPGGRIRLSVEREGDEVVLRVTDNGIGIDPGQLEQAFAMFSRAGTDLQSGYGGLGIGLTLARQLAQMHGGTLTGHSEGAGKGSAFTLRLPLGVRQGAPAAPAAAGADPSLRGYRVLIADDNEDAALSIALLVCLLGGREVHTAHDGVEALEKARALHPDIVVLDLGMPRMDGYETARQIRREPWGQTPTLIALSGWGRDEDRRRSQEAGFDHHLLKPADRAALAAVFSTARGGAREQAGGHG